MAPCVPGSRLAGVTAIQGCSNAAVNQTLGVLFKYKHIESVLFCVEGYSREPSVLTAPARWYESLPLPHSSSETDTS